MRGIFLVATLFLVALSGCLDSDDADTVGGKNDVGTNNPGKLYSLPEMPSGLEFVTSANNQTAEGIWVWNNYVYASGPAGLRIIDVKDPHNPILVASDIEGTTASRDIDLIHHENGHVYAVIAHGGSRISLTDVTIPSNPVLVSEVTNIGPAHNIAVVPGTAIVYNSRSISTHVPAVGSTGAIDIVDFTDPMAPVVSIFNFPAVAMTVSGVPRPVVSTTCHDVTFAERDDDLLAVCAGVTDIQIWNVNDALNPTIVQVIDWPANQILHGAWLVQNATVLIIGDEFAGAAAGPMCGPVPQPYAALWFFDLSDMALPVPAGFYQSSYSSLAEQNTALCTTHFGTPVEDRTLFVMGWYTSGTVLVDYSDLSAPREVAIFRPDGPVNTWDARYYNGHVYTGDTARGIDVLAIV